MKVRNLLSITEVYIAIFVLDFTLSLLTTNALCREIILHVTRVAACPFTEREVSIGPQPRWQRGGVVGREEALLTESVVVEGAAVVLPLGGAA